MALLSILSGAIPRDEITTILIAMEITQISGLKTDIRGRNHIFRLFTEKNP